MSPRLTPTLSQAPGPDVSGGATLHEETSSGVPEIGERLGRYTILGQIGVGGMGAVYSAHDELLARRVALKLVRTDARGGVAHSRILREAQALARLSHPNVVQLYEVSAAAGRVFLAMEHVEGVTLGSWTAARRAAGCDLREILDMYVQAGRGLAAAHAAGLVHRDFKPDNVVVGDDGRARVVDFGLVAVPSAADGPQPRPGPARPSASQLSVVGELLGTPAYMSPEQFAGRTADPHSDQFSFCVALHEAVCGARPFAGRDVDELRAAVVGGRLRPPPPELPPWLWALLRRGLATDPGERFPTMDALLAGLAADPIAVRLRRRRNAGLALLSAVAAVLVALLVQAGWQRWQRLQRERAADQGLVATETRLQAAEAAGDRAAAEQMFVAFVDDPHHHGTAALARAWLGEAGRRTQDGSRGAAQAAFAAAYLAAPDDELQAEALTRLARHFHAGVESQAFAQAFALLERRHPEVARDPSLAELRTVAALARRDFAQARDAASGSTLQPLLTALSGATATAHRSAYAVAVNATHVLLVDETEGRHSLSLATRDPALTLVYRERLAADVSKVHVIGTEPFHAVLSAPNKVLVRVDERGVVPIYRWPDGAVLSAGAADLDGDGVREIYVGGGAATGIDRVVEDGRGGWSAESVYSDSDTLRSAVHDLVGVDLDEDGRDELVAALGGWWSLDVRVLRRDPATGRLTSVARDKVGYVRGLVPLRTDAGPLLVANHLYNSSSSLVFPRDRPWGEPEGLHLYRLDGSELRRRGILRQPISDHWGLAAADVDGDGVEDLAIRHTESELRHTVLQLQREGGAFTPVHLGQLRFLAFAQVDEDAPHELVAEIADEDGARRVWVVGAGADELPPVAAAPSVAVALVDPADATWTREASRAASLADLGLRADAAEALRRLGRRAASSALRGRASLRAAELFERDASHRDAIDMYRVASGEPTTAVDAHQGLLRAQLRVGDYDDAGATLAALMALPGLGDDARAELTRHGDLADVMTERIDLDFSQPLAPAWEIGNAGALRRAPDGLSIETMAPGLLLALPIDRSDDLFELHADISLRQFEWSSDLEIGVVPGDDPLGAMSAKIRVASSGTSRGGFTVTRHYTCEVAQRELSGAVPDATITDRDAPIRVDIRVAFTPALGETGCETRDHAAPRSRHIRRHDVPLPPGGRSLLVVRYRNEVPAWLDATLHGIRLRGATVRDAPSADPRRAELRRAVMARDAVAVVAAAAELDELTASELVWQADALAQLGRRREAEARWAVTLAAPELDRDLASRLRAEPAYGPLLHAVDPAGHAARLATVWRNTAVNHLGDPAARRVMGTALAGLDVDAAVGDLARGHVADLLDWRGRMRMHDGEPTRARADFERALAVIATLGPDAPQRAGLWRIWLELATLAAAEGDASRARDAVRRAREASSMPLLVDDIVRARAELHDIVAAAPR